MTVVTKQCNNQQNWKDHDRDKHLNKGYLLVKVEVKYTQIDKHIHTYLPTNQHIQTIVPYTYVKDIHNKT